MSACLDPMKLIYVAMLGFVIPIGMKIASLFHGASDSQTFEMLTGKVGVAFILMVLCLGLAGNTSTQGGRGGEYLPLIFTRPMMRAEYVITKWLAITAIGGVLAVIQNIIIITAGSFFGDTLSTSAIVSMLIERMLDAAIISAGMLLMMLYKNPIFQIAAIVAFYVWLTGQTLPPVSIAGSGAGTEEMSLQATKVLLATSQIVSELILPTVNVYDLLNSHSYWLAPVMTYASTLVLYLVLSIVAINKREFFYGTQ